MRCTFLLVGTLALFAAPAWGQTLSDLQPGSDLQIETRDHRTIYSVLERTGVDTLFVSQGRDPLPRPMPIAEMQSLHVRVPRSSGSGALRGMLIGGGIGGLTGMVIALSSREESQGCGQLSGLCESTVTFAKVIGYTGLLGMAGMAVGGMVGAAAPGSQWKPVPLPQGLSILYPEREGIVVQYAWSF